MTEAPHPAISVIVPSYNSARTIVGCLEALTRQQTRLDYEIIVVDSSTDDTPELVRAFAPRVQLLLSEQQLFPGPARNAGIGRGRADIFAFTDADCRVAPDWIERIHRAHADHDAVGGRILNGTPGNICGTALYLAEFVEFAAGRDRRCASVPSCNISYKRSLFEKYGTFPDVPWGEEYILNTRIRDGISFAAAVAVHHVNRTGLAETVRHARKVGHGAALSRRATGQVAWLFRFRFLVPLLFFYRLIRIGRAAVGSGQALAFLAAGPVLVVDLVAWTLGFWAGTGAPLLEGLQPRSLLWERLPPRFQESGLKPLLQNCLPQISVVLPVFNGEETIGATIASVLAQTYRDFEVLVVDDGSTDRGADIVRAIADPRVRLLSFANAGPSASRNRGIAQARGEFVAFIDADDLWTPDKLERQRQALLDHPGAALAYSWTDCIDGQGRLLQHGSHVRVDGPPYPILVARNFLDTGSNPLVRRAALAEAGPFDEQLWNAEDWDLWLRIGYRRPFVCVPAVQILYRVIPRSNAANIARQVAGTLEVLRRGLARLPPSAARDRQGRVATANLYKYIAVRLVQTAQDRRDGCAAARYGWQFITTTPTPVRQLPQALIILCGFLAVLLLPRRGMQALRNAWSALRS